MASQCHGCSVPKHIKGSEPPNDRHLTGDNNSSTTNYGDDDVNHDYWSQIHQEGSTAGLIFEHATSENAAQGSQTFGLHLYGIENAIAQAGSARNLVTTSAFGISVADEQLSAPPVNHSTSLETVLPPRNTTPSPRFDFFRGMSSYPQLLMELAKHLSMPAFLALYSVSREFNSAINGHLTHSVRLAASHQAFESCTIFPFNLYELLCCNDPAGRPHPRLRDQVRKAPSLRWLQMVVHREKVVRDILACMARQGHRMPKEMSLALKKMWLVMDLATSAQRVQFMHNATFFTARDLYHIQMFVVKLDMRFNDPIDGPGDDCLRKLFLGQRGLTPLRDCLKRTAFTSSADVIKLAVRYKYKPARHHRHLPIWGIPPDEIGVGHLEGWGMGRVHLLRPDELVVREAVRRQLDLKNHVMGMMLWGYVDAVTGLNTAPTYEEKYMSDDEEVEKKVRTG